MSKINWILEIAKGLLILIFGLFCLIYPTSASITLSWVFALIILIFGIIAITDSFSLKDSFTLWWIFLIEFAIDVVIAAILLFNPDKTNLLVTLTGIFALVTGVFRFLRILAKKDLWAKYVLFGVLALIIGLLLLIFSEAIIAALTIIVGTIIFLFGIVVVVFGVKMKLNKQK